MNPIKRIYDIGAGWAIAILILVILLNYWNIKSPLDNYEYKNAGYGFFTAWLTEVALIQLLLTLFKHKGQKIIELIVPIFLGLLFLFLVKFYSGHFIFSFYLTISLLIIRRLYNLVFKKNLNLPIDLD